MPKNPKMRKIRVDKIERMNKIDQIRIIRQMHNSVLRPLVEERTGITLPDARVTPVREGIYKVSDVEGQFHYLINIGPNHIEYELPLDAGDADFFLSMLLGAVKSVLPVGKKLLTAALGKKNAGWIDKVGGAVTGAINIAQGNVSEGISGIAGAMLNKKKSESKKQIERVSPQRQRVPEHGKTAQAVKAANIKVIEASLPKNLKRLAPVVDAASNVFSSQNLKSIKANADFLAQYSAQLGDALNDLLQNLRDNKKAWKSLKALSSIAI
jgi:hypothetical protein